MFKIDKRLFLYFSIIFFAETIIGTLLHESGHYLAAKFMGFDPKIHYMSTSPRPDRIVSVNEHFWIVFGGPLGTMMIGTIGFLLLLISRPIKERLTTWQWIFVLISVFWLLMPIAFLFSFYSFLVTGQPIAREDLIKSSRILEWGDWTIMLVAVFLGTCISAIVIFRIIPKPKRFTFILAGMIGGFFGALFWANFGKYFLP